MKIDRKTEVFKTSDFKDHKHANEAYQAVISEFSEGYGLAISLAVYTNNDGSGEISIHTIDREKQYTFDGEDEEEREYYQRYDDYYDALDEYEIIYEKMNSECYESVLLWIIADSTFYRRR